MGGAAVFLAVLGISLALTAAFATLPAFGLMILLGIVHSYVATVPAIGYGTAYVVALCIGVVVSLFRSAASATVSK